ncbi:MAG: thymidylate kinase [Ruminococcaceae bacterium]|nr:thymidylate kinase [Oscillospiraceae bacterium]
MGKLIIMEGLDGSGKSTQTALLEDYLKSRDVNYKKIKLPDYESKSSTLVNMYLGGEFGSDANAVNPYAAGAFYAVDRFASFMLRWKNDYENGILILADRYATSNSIYQMEKLDKSQWDEYLDWSADFEYNKIGIPKPDLVIYLDMPIEISQKLMTKRYDGNEDKKDVHEANVEFLQKCRTSALYAAKKQGWKVVECSDGVNPLSIEEIHRRIKQIVDEEL